MIQKTATRVVEYFWHGAVEPLVSRKHLDVPQEGEDVALELPIPATSGQTPPAVVVRGQVVEVNRVGEAAHVVLRRIGQTGLPYDVLCALINVRVSGYHPVFGRVAGKLVGLLPSSELAGIADNSLKAAVAVIAANQGEEPDPEEDCVIWVDWSTVWREGRSR